MDGSAVPLPLLMSEGEQVCVERKGGLRRMVLLRAVHVAFGGDSVVTVTAAAEPQEQLCRICVHPENEGTKRPPSCSSKQPQEPCTTTLNPVPNPNLIPRQFFSNATC